jgi:alpha-tubulin suppressor-like RCC1 family protein
VLACREVGCSQPSDTAQAPHDAIQRASSPGVGREHTCALQVASGDVLCWGANDYAQVRGDLGSDVTSPVSVSTGTKYEQIATGYNRSCGIAVDGRTYCWGAWSDVPGVDASPQLVPGGITFQTISLGPNHACGVTTGGKAYCWGSNHSYQLARSDSTLRTTTPLLVPGSLTFRTISAGYDHTCGVTTTNQAYCWGWNGSGQLGIDDTLQSHSDAPLAVAGGHSFATVSAGDQHTCGVTTSGLGYCWGNNDGGQLGTTSGVGSSYAPLPVSGSHVFAGISAGSEYTCGVTTAGAAYCWGINEVGNLGTGTNASSNSPSLVAGGHTFLSVTAKFSHTCGIDAGHELYCWGWNGRYQLGDETTDNHNVPAVVRLSVPIYAPGSS